MKFAPITHFYKKSNECVETNKNSNMHDGLSEDSYIESVECEETLVEQRKEETEDNFLHKGDNKKAKA